MIYLNIDSCQTIALSVSKGTCIFLDSTKHPLRLLSLITMSLAAPGAVAVPSLAAVPSRAVPAVVAAGRPRPRHPAVA